MYLSLKLSSLLCLQVVTYTHTKLAPLSSQVQLEAKRRKQEEEEAEKKKRKKKEKEKKNPGAWEQLGKSGWFGPDSSF